MGPSKRRQVGVRRSVIHFASRVDLQQLELCRYMSKSRLNKLNCQLCGRYASVGACRYIGTYKDTYAYAYLCMRTARIGKSIRHNEVATLVMEVRRPVPCAQQRDRSACEIRIASTTFIQWSSRSAVAFGQSCSSAHRTSNSKSRAGEPRSSPGIVSDRPCQYGIRTAHMLSKYAMVTYLRFTQSAGKAWSPSWAHVLASTTIGTQARGVRH